MGERPAPSAALESPAPAASAQTRNEMRGVYVQVAVSVKRVGWWVTRYYTVSLYTMAIATTTTNTKWCLVGVRFAVQSILAFVVTCLEPPARNFDHSF